MLSIFIRTKDKWCFIIVFKHQVAEFFPPVVVVTLIVHCTIRLSYNFLPIPIKNIINNRNLWLNEIFPMPAHIETYQHILSITTDYNKQASN
jgi:hypothetical protein